ncbi:MAG: hypothetical protein GXO23_01065 [Crenarchaeota archaeon]|nr:hypothetical protein [Thermoproteota archaeon]
MSVELERMETAYQILIAEDPDVVRQDCEVRYGDRWPIVFDEARKLIDEMCRDMDREECVNMIIKDYGDKIARLVIERAGELFEKLKPIIRYFNKNAHSPVSHGELFCLLKLCDIDADLSVLVRIGVVMHVDREHVLAPHYLSLYDDCYVSPEEYVEAVSSEPAKAAILESLIENVRPMYEMFEKLYGIAPDSPSLYNMGRLLAFCEAVGRPIFNPCVDLHELRSVFHETKQIKARRLFRIIEPGMGHVKYSKKVGALISYIMLGPGEHGVIMFMPWILPSRRLESYHSSSPRVIVTSIPFRREFAEYFHSSLEDLKTFRNTAFLFVQEGLAYLVAPSRKSRTLDSLLDLIYRSGLEITEF